MRFTGFRGGGRGTLSGDGRLPVGCMIGEGPAAFNYAFDLPPFTRGATTRVVNVPYATVWYCAAHGFYRCRSAASSSGAAQGMGAQEMSDDGALEARRARVAPRIANHLLRRWRDFAEVKSGRFLQRKCRAGIYMDNAERRCGRV